MNESDHDLIIEMRGDIKSLKADIADLKDNVKARIDDHESRLRFIETKMWLAIGGLVIIQFIIGYYLIAHFGNTPL